MINKNTHDTYRLILSERFIQTEDTEKNKPSETKHSKYYRKQNLVLTRADKGNSAVIW